MMKLSPRLQKIAALVNSAKVADIGTDHAFLPVYLAKERRMEKLIATDLNSGPLAIAAKQINDSDCSDLIELRQGSGLSCLVPGEVDEIVIAGMGGELIADILAEGLSSAKKSRRLILQPMSKSAELRAFLNQQGFSLVEEALAREDYHIYEIIVAEWTGRSEAYTALEIKFGPCLLSQGGELFYLFLKQKKEKCEKILAVLADKEGNRVRKEEQLLRKELAQLKEAEQWLKHRQL